MPQNLDEFDDGYLEEAVRRRQSQLDASLPDDRSESGTIGSHSCPVFMRTVQVQIAPWPCTVLA